MFQMDGQNIFQVPVRASYVMSSRYKKILKQCGLTDFLVESYPTSRSYLLVTPRLPPSVGAFMFVNVPNCLLRWEYNKPSDVLSSNIGRFVKEKRATAFWQLPFYG